MAKKLFLLAVTLLVISCGKKDKDVPAGILSQEQMVDLLIDIRIAEGMVSTVSMAPDSASAIFRELEKRIFLEHGVDSASYVQSHNYYILNPELYLEVTDIVIDSLKARNSKQYSKNY